MFGVGMDVAIAALGFVLLIAFLVKGWADFQEWTIYTSQTVQMEKLELPRAVLCGLLAIAEAVLLGAAIAGTYLLMSAIYTGIASLHDAPFCLFSCG